MKGPGRGSWQAAAEEIREKLGRFAGRPRFNKEFEEAFEFFFGERVETLQETLDEADFDRFMEWFVHDYRLSNGHRLIEMFDLEHGADLSRSARRILRHWHTSHLTLLELVGEEGEVYRFRDLLQGGEIQVPAGPLGPFEEEPPPWSVVIARPLPVGEMWDLSPAATVLPASVKEPLLQAIRGEFRRFRRASACQAVGSFLRERGYVFNDLLSELDGSFDGFVEPEKPHRLIRCRAVFEVRDAPRVWDRLLAYPDIVEGRKGRLVWRVEPPVKGRGKRRPQILAEVETVGGRLQVHCWSRERLEAAKEMVGERLGGLALHLLDAYDEGPAVPEGAAGSDGWADAFDDYVRHWLVDPLWAGGPAPALLLRKPLGRLRVVEYLKRVEHNECMLKRRWVRGIAWELRKRLGLQGETGLVVPLGERPGLWNSASERAVAELAEKTFSGMGLSQEHVETALWIWWDFCSRAFPSPRKPESWVAALYYCLGIVENWRVTQSDAARLLGVGQASTSQILRKITTVLRLEPFDARYCVEHPADGLLSRGDRSPAGAPEPAGDALVTIAASNRLRDALHRFAAKHDGLRDRARDFFASHVSCTKDDPTWREGFVDWFHFDWRVPVMGGRTIAEEAAEHGELSDADRRMLEAWCSCHPSFYVVELVEGHGREGGLEGRVALKDLEDGTVTVVDWLRTGRPLGPKDVVFARLVPVGDITIGLGPAVVLPPRLRESVKRALEEERALVNRWNGRALSWDEFRARYAERLYAIACRAFREGHES